jgi:hypothetical protein
LNVHYVYFEFDVAGLLAAVVGVESAVDAADSLAADAGSVVAGDFRGYFDRLSRTTIEYRERLSWLEEHRDVTPLNPFLNDSRMHLVRLASTQRHPQMENYWPFCRKTVAA